MTRMVDVPAVEAAATRLTRMGDEVVALDATARTLLAQAGEPVSLEVAWLRVLSDDLDRAAHDLRRRAAIARAGASDPVVRGAWASLPPLATLLAGVGADLPTLWRRLPEADRRGRITRPLLDELFAAAGRVPAHTWARRLQTVARVLGRLAARPDAAVEVMGSLGLRRFGFLADAAVALQRSGELRAEDTAAIGANLSAVLAAALRTGAVAVDDVAEALTTPDGAVLLSTAPELPAEAVLALLTVALPAPVGGAPMDVAGREAAAEALARLTQRLGDADVVALAPRITALLAAVPDADLTTWPVALHDALLGLLARARVLLAPPESALPGLPPSAVLDEVTLRRLATALGPAQVAAAVVPPLAADLAAEVAVAARLLTTSGRPGLHGDVATAQDALVAAPRIGATIGLLVDVLGDEQRAGVGLVADVADLALEAVTAVLAAGVVSGLVAGVTGERLLGRVEDAAAARIESGELQVATLLEWTILAAIAAAPGVPPAPRERDGRLLRWWQRSADDPDRRAFERWRREPTVVQLFGLADGALATYHATSRDAA